VLDKIGTIKTGDSSLKKALVTGITGQDGSYLAELLLEKGYEVHGLVRRASTFNRDRIACLGDGSTPATLQLHYGDLSDASGLRDVIERVTPDEIYNLGAQSHVKVSFEQAEYTADVTGLGALRLLEAVRSFQARSGKEVRYYQASSSEMFGAAPPPQSLQTPFHPRSPYGVAKVYAFWQTANHRESYDMFACNGILFNHECITENTPLLVRHNGVLDVATARTLVPLRRKGTNVQHFEPTALEVWDGRQWTPINAITATKRRKADKDHRLLSVQARGGVVDVTAHHHMLDAREQTCRADEVSAGDLMALAQHLPDSPGWAVLSPEMAEFLGLMSAEGYVSLQDKKLQFTNNNPLLRERVAQLWKSLFVGECYEWIVPSGWNPRQGVVQMALTGAKAAHEWLREQLYTGDGHKRVPPLVLNATPELQAHYLRGHYAGDGLKAGKGESIKTNSAVLAQGLYYLYANQGRFSSVYVEQRGSRSYYQLNIFSSQPTSVKGAHLRKEPAQVRRVEPSNCDSEWVFDLETQSGVFCAGVGRLIVHNSPRRGETFVTRKITRAVGRIKAGLQDELYLGNLDAKRDWGHARDYVEAMYLMLQQEAPRDYVIATGEAYSVREFAERAFELVGLDYQKYVKVDERFFRPAEVDYLLGDAQETRAALNWQPRTSFEQLVQEMVEADLALAQQEKMLQDAGYGSSAVESEV
jgi:GDPmannose 4,6-dehydratase